MEGNRARMGEVLLSSGVISCEQLDTALEEQEHAGGRLGEVLVRQLVVTEDQIAHALAIREGLRHVNLTEVEIDQAAVSLIPEQAARRHAILPIGFRGERLVLAMADPLDVEAIDDAALYSHLKIEPVVVPASQLRYAIEKYLVGEDAIQELVRHEAITLPDEQLRPEAYVSDVPVVRIVNQILRTAIADRASDVHFEPDETSVKVRCRIDGVLVDVAELPKSSQPSLTSRLKVMAELDIAERRRPQDGRIAMRVDSRIVDMRVALLPTPLGESIVIRILDAATQSRAIDEIGLTPANRAHLDRMLERPYGAILITGPTGSGKTTTLYAALNQINQRSRKVITIEDPIEYRLAGLTQVAVNPRIGLTFATGLREVLRSDPDIVMVGEVRDVETAAIAVRAALTGHLVLSSIHTNDAPSALTRLSEMGVESYISSSAVVGTIAQRLLRVLCTTCKKPVKVPAEQLVALGFTADQAAHAHPFGPVGCVECRMTGYKGRIAVFEFMEMNDALRALLLRRASAEEMRVVALQSGMRSLRDDALDKVAAGVTSIEEMVRVVA